MRRAPGLDLAGSQPESFSRGLDEGLKKRAQRPVGRPSEKTNASLVNLLGVRRFDNPPGRLDNSGLSQC